VATRWKHQGPQDANDVVAWFEASRRGTKGPIGLILTALLVVDVLVIRWLLRDPSLLALLILSIFVPFTVLLLGEVLVPRFFKRTGPSRYDDPHHPLFEVSVAEQGPGRAVAKFAGSHAVVLREPSSDPGRLIRDLSEVAGISPAEARLRVLGDPQDVPGRWATIAESVSTLVYGPGRVLRSIDR